MQRCGDLYEQTLYHLSYADEYRRKGDGRFFVPTGMRRATDIYYRLNREKKADGFICGRITMEGSFTGGFYPDLSQYEPVRRGANGREDFIGEDRSGFYAVAFDTHGKLGWKACRIVDPDGDPGYDGAQIIEVLSEEVDERYLGYLRSMKIPYIFAGKNTVDVDIALCKLKELFGCKTLLLEGGSILNGSFEKASAVDELSLVVTPTVAGQESSPLFADACIADFKLQNVQTEKGILVLNYRRKS